MENGNALLPSGVIMMWSGLLATIPPGWRACDGTSGTPDLRGRFIVGVGPDYGIGATGGAADVTLTTNQMPAHSHTSTQPTAGRGSTGSLASTLVPDGVSLTGTFSAPTSSVGGGQPHTNLPPYFALIYIMKI
jgi:microcystin-dependent protein